MTACVHPTLIQTTGTAVLLLATSASSHQAELAFAMRLESALLKAELFWLAGVSAASTRSSFEFSFFPAPVGEHLQKRVFRGEPVLTRVLMAARTFPYTYTNLGQVLSLRPNRFLIIDNSLQAPCTHPTSPFSSSLLLPLSLHSLSPFHKLCTLSALVILADLYPP